MEITPTKDFDFYLFDSLAANFIQLAPKVIMGLVFIILCWIILRITLFLLSRFFKFSKIDLFVDNLMGEAFKGNKVPFEISKTILLIIRWFLIFIFILIGSDLLGLKILSYELGKILNYFPQFISGVAILILGLYLAVTIKRTITSTMTVMGLMGAKIVGQFLFWILIVFILITSLNQIGIDTSFITNNLSIIIGSFFAAIALAFGLGSKTIVQKILYVFYARRIYNISDKVIVDDEEGIIIAIDNLSFTILCNETKVILPIEDVLNKKTIIKL